MAKNRKLAKQLNQRKIYLFFSKSSMKKHRKNKAFVLLNPTFKDIIGYQTSYDTSNSVYYTVNKKTGNFKCVSKSDKKSTTLPGYGFSVHKITAKDRAYSKKLLLNKKEMKPIILSRSACNYDKGRIISNEDNDGWFGKALTYKGKQYFASWANGYITNVKTSEVKVLKKLLSV
ncbi:hypothetical protein [Lactobacillus kefiranofaciens]|uniref:Uncharacterized protein n=2 Tax=Lactobacillus kefiranofaciens TaxID=267818 RepID=A0AAX3UCN5_9LACO|nr:hypothetical protein [Lactobacillus kefiranofaciens]AEG41133.1 hypothetical protein WANG_1438 [Lactobacillus kefiranofaciens subsp. kefiranofaciens]KRM20418.1 hypothetical protein FC93_GL001627 [Lactobacillus kefiranofaciens subsp. kefiranofaciens DSM 5016 = JCM 6985]MDF4142749.1 hypothetical protein [Lactobacillus kefiranofaciens]QFQ67034.1 hypothetical protein LKK75_00190 [Lactobacillus kefiranofaciens subsp. kefiranofaciens]WGO85421.1 hypothetical protein QEJ78_08620 [Lactobacillus kefir